MSDPASKEMLPANLEEHRAFKAWRQIRPEGPEPQNIQVLKLKRRKSAVYRLTGVGSNSGAVIAKRCPTTTASVERFVYQDLLPRLALPALGCYGFVPELGDEFCWLFLEDAGTNEYSRDSAEHRALAGRWLRTIHRVARFADFHTRLPDRGLDHYLQLLRLSRATLLERAGSRCLSADEVTLLQTVAAQFDMIEAHWEEVERFCEGLPPTLVHGDFAVKNLRIQPGPTGPALLVYDWEMAGWGVPATDLAQFVGRCASPELDAYASAVRHDFPQLDVRDIQRLADYGNVLRVVDEVYWATLFMVSDAYDFLLQPLRMIIGIKRKWPRHCAPSTGVSMIERLDEILEGGGQPGLTELRELVEELLGGRQTPGRLLEQQMLQPKGSRVFRLRFDINNQTRSLVIKRLKPEIARRNELVAKRWLPAVGLNDRGTPLLGSVADRSGVCVWQVYDDLGQHELDPHEPDREQVRAAVELIARMHTRFARHALLGEIRLHGGDFGIHFYESNVLDAIYALEVWQPDPPQSALRDRLLGRLHKLRDAIPQRAQALTELGGPETLLHGDLWAINVFVIPTANGLHARLIDWDHAAVGPASYDLSTFLLRFPAEHRQWILELYRQAVAEAGWRLPAERDLNLLFETHEYARFANRIIWPAIALVTDRAAWGLEALAEIDEWFEQFDPVLPGGAQMMT